MGLGNADYGDDGFGVRLAQELIAQGMNDVIVAGTTPDRWIGQLTEPFDHIIFLDAVEFGDTPGSLVFLDSGEISVAFPQISTHKISLAVLARLAEANGKTRAWLLGVQPQSLRPAPILSQKLETTLEALRELLLSLGRPRKNALAEQQVKAALAERVDL
jgi:hydrogenase maturation protease